MFLRKVFSQFFIAKCFKKLLLFNLYNKSLKDWSLRKPLASSAGVFWEGETLFVFILPVAAIFDFMTVEDLVTLRVGARAKEGKGRGGGEEKNTPARYHCSFGKLRTLANGALDWCGIGK